MMPGNRWVFLLPFLAFAALLTFLFMQNGKNPTVDTFALLDKPLPGFDLMDLESPGRRLSEKDFAGSPALINVWATWCSSCWAEHDMLLKVAGSRVPVYGVLYKDERDSALAYLQKRGNPFKKIANDAVGSLGLDLGVTGAPETFLVDRQGVIRYHMNGPITDDIWEKILKPRYIALQSSQVAP